MSVYNILSSNIINLIQYLAAIIANKNVPKLKNMAIKVDVAMVIMTIIVPIILLQKKIILDRSIIPLFLILYIGCTLLKNKSHRIYLDDVKSEEVVETSINEINKSLALICVIILLITGVLLFIVSEQLGDTLEQLCILFHVPELIVGVLLGFITSIPELITFFESQRHHKKEKNDMLGVIEATNNLLTSNIVNLFIIQTIGILMTRA